MQKRYRVRLGFAFRAALVAMPALAAPALAAPSGNDVAPLGVPLDEAGALDPGSLSGAYLAARHAGLNKDLAAAAVYYTEALGRDPDYTELLKNSVLMNVASGNVERAAELAEGLLEEDPTEQVALMTLAIEHLKAGRNDEALATVGRLTALGGQLQELIGTLLSAWAMTADGRAAQAINTLDELSGPPWFSAFTTLHAGLVADHARLFEIAGERLRRAYERDPGAVRVADAYARFLARSGDRSRALSVLAAFEERVGGSDVFTRGLRADIEEGEVAAQIGSPAAGAAEALYGIGTAVGREGGDTFAASLLQLAQYLWPEGTFPAMALGQVLESMRQYQAAIDIYRRIPEGSPLKRNAAMQEALNLNALERNEEAIAILETLVADDPTDIAVSSALGNVYRSLERFADAETIYSASIEALGDVPEAYWTLYYYRGIARERTNQWPGAEADFRKALAMEPEQPLTLNYLGYSLIDRGEKLDEAIDMVRRAVAAKPDDGYIVDSLGWAYFRLQRWDDAVRELERAVSLTPGDPVINDHLGDAYWRVGRKLEATFQWAHARDSKPPAEIRDVILKKLAHGLDAAEREMKAADAGGVAVPPDAKVTPAPSSPQPAAPAAVPPAPAGAQAEERPDAVN